MSKTKYYKIEELDGEIHIWKKKGVLEKCLYTNKPEIMAKEYFKWHNPVDYNCPPILHILKNSPEVITEITKKQAFIESL